MPPGQEGPLRRESGAFAVCVFAAASLAALAAWAEAPVLPEPDREVFQQDVAWSPDGAWLAFSELDLSSGEYDPANWSVWVAKADGSERAQVKRGAVWVSWAPDGERLVFGSSGKENRDLHIARRDGGALTRLTSEEGKDVTPAWSPQGDRIAFSSDRAGSLDLWVVAPDGTGAMRLTSDPASDYNPAWSPDGAQIVFYREKGDGMDQIWTVAADGSAERQITDDDANNVFPTFRPDGRIVFASMRKDAPEELVTVAADGSGRARVEIPETGFARWSPDGKTIAFVAGRWPKSAIYVMDAGGGAVRKIVN